MAFQKNIDQSFKFLILEVVSQVQEARKALDEGSTVSFEKIDSRDDYIDNLKAVIESKCFSQLGVSGEVDKSTVDLVKAVVVVATNLERMADYAVNIVRQIRFYHDKSFIRRYDYASFFAEILRPMGFVHEAVFNRDIPLGLQVCRSEFVLDDLYEAVFLKIRDELHSGENTEDLLTSIFVFRYLERIGDCLLNIGEAVISSAIGEKLKIHQFQALEETLEKSRLDKDISDYDFESIWETRSGCRIARVVNKNHGGASSAAIFKEGRLKKLLAEKESIERWQGLMPGLTPKLFAFEQHGDNGSLLLECVPGRTLKELVLHSDDDTIMQALHQLARVLKKVWTKTQKPTSVNAGHFSQLLDRIDDVHRVHPEYRLSPNRIGSVASPSFEEMLKRAIPLEVGLNAPFTVLIHGDLNIDNVIYNDEDQSVHFVDLHRSRETDYAQDVSVFIVSNFRLQVEDAAVIGRINKVIEQSCKIASEFAATNDDRTFEARLTLGLIRSLATSTRFELEEKFAKSMYLRAIFLLEKVIEHDGRPWEEFRLPRQALVH